MAPRFRHATQGILSANANQERQQPPSLAHSPLDRTKGGESATCRRKAGSTIRTIPGLAAQSWDPRFARENRMVRIRTLCIHTSGMDTYFGGSGGRN